MIPELTPAPYRLPFRHPKPYIPSHNGGTKAMTIVAGIQCKNGVVLAADREITVGQIGKTYESKIFLINKGQGCHVSYAGSTDFMKELVSQLREAAAGKTGNVLLLAIKDLYQQSWNKHFTEPPEVEKTFAELLITIKIYGEPHLYFASGHHFYKVSTYKLLGVGSEQVEPLFNSLGCAEVDISQASCMAIYALRKSKGYAQGCGGTTESLRVANPHLGLKIGVFGSIPERSTLEIEEDFDLFDKLIQPVLLAYPDFDVHPDKFKSMFQSVMKELVLSRNKKRRKRIKEERRACEEESKLSEQNPEDE